MLSRSTIIPSVCAGWIALRAAGGTPPAVCIHGHLSVPTEYTQSDAVLIGRVVGHRTVPASDSFEDGDVYRVRVRERLRGRLPASFEVFSENSNGRFPMHVDSTYLMFVYRERGRIIVDNCGNSGLLGATAAVLDTVRVLQRKSPA